MQRLVALDIQDGDGAAADPRDICLQVPLAWYFAIHGQNDWRVRAMSEGRSGRGVDTTRNSMRTPPEERLGSNMASACAFVTLGPKNRLGEGGTQHG